MGNVRAHFCDFSDTIRHASLFYSDGEQAWQTIDVYKRQDVDLAAEMHRRLLPLFKVIFITTNPIPVKAALDLSGFDAGGLRPPLVEATDAERKQIERVMETLGLI